ncbi:MAG: secondary thiamine-phosphate synthase enzyme YjbQ [Thermodesulfobacteriota bacterium]
MAHTVRIELGSKGFADVIDITGPVEAAVAGSGVSDGLVTVFVPGSTGSVTTIEYESGVVADLAEAIERLVPSAASYRHDARWGDGNGFSHVRAALMKPGLTVPVAGGSMTLGTWQQIVFIDFDNRPRTRSIVVQVTEG